MEPFTYESRGKVMTMGYHEVPPDVLEQPMELVIWARKAIEIAAAKSKKPSRSSAKKTSRAKNQLTRD